MAALKLTYFDFPASRGEECRLALHLAGVEFHDHRITPAQWPTVKPQTPFGSVPVLEVDGLGTLSQSNAILVYVGRLHGLHPSEPWRAAQHEQLLSAAEELRGKAWQLISVKEEPLRTAARKDLTDGLLKSWGHAVDKLLGAGPFAEGAEIHVVDLKLYMVVRWFASGAVDQVPADVFDECTRLRRLYDAVSEHPGVRAWYAKTGS